MLYHIFSYLNEYQITGARLFGYTSFRAGLALIIAILISTVLGRHIIRMLQRLQIGEEIRDLDLAGQLQKRGTPTMGGLIIIVSILIPTLLLARLNSVYILLMLLTTVVMGALGFLDDYLKRLKKNKDGLAGRYKMVVQILLGLIIGVVLYMSPAVVIKENQSITTEQNTTQITHEAESHKSTKTTIPFFKNNHLDYSEILPLNGTAKTIAGLTIFVLMTAFVLSMMSNCVNLTDGLDGLASGLSAVVGAALGVFAYVSSHYGMASYLNIMFIPGAQELVVFAAAFVGACMGFFWYNGYPAQIFMGDTGSLTLGGIIGVFAIIIRKELLLPILCGVFIVEGISVILQVFYFQYTKRKSGEGKRILRMSPLHHHFQKGADSGIKALWNSPRMPMHESKITIRFILVGIILAMLSIVTLKIR